MIIWLLAIGQVMNNITNVASYIAYGAGFATGTFVGMAIEEKLSLGTVIVRVITNHEAKDLVEYLRANNYGVTAIDATGSIGSCESPLHGDQKTGRWQGNRDNQAVPA